MVDTTTIIIIATVVQTVVITLTLAVFIFQFRSQEKLIRESAVQTVMGRYTDYVRMLVEKPELTKLLNQPDVVGAEIADDDKVLAAYMLLGYGIFEEIYSLYKRGWMDEETWKQWSSFIERMSRQPIFQQVHNFSSGTWDRDFQDYVSGLIKKGKSGPPSGPK